MKLFLSGILQNKIGDLGTKYLGLGLSKLIKLNYLEFYLYQKVSSNKIGDLGTKYLGLGLSKLIRLIYLDLDLRL